MDEGVTSSKEEHGFLHKLERKKFLLYMYNENS
jgi:hypothetical protein